MPIKLKQISLKNGHTQLTFQCQKGTVTINDSDVTDRLKRFNNITGKQATKQDLKHILVQLVNEQTLQAASVPVFDYSELINVDLDE